jgi:hypothetical protein
MNSRFGAPAALVALILLGAGCAASTPATPDNQPSASVADSAAAMTDVSDSETDAAAAQPAVELTPTLAADREGEWSTYTNAALGFSFDWPSTGKYAPRWAVDFLESAEVTDGCYQDGTNQQATVAVGDQEFCHTWTDTGEGSASATDYYVTTIGEQSVRISFTKDSSGIYEFDWTEYRAFLDQIIAGFQL